METHGDTCMHHGHMLYTCSPLQNAQHAPNKLADTNERWSTRKAAGSIWSISSIAAAFSARRQRAWATVTKL